jgi:hypothetical protein
MFIIIQRLINMFGKLRRWDWQIVTDFSENHYASMLRDGHYKKSVLLLV